MGPMMCQMRMGLEVGCITNLCMHGKLTESIIMLGMFVSRRMRLSRSSCFPLVSKPLASISLKLTRMSTLRRESLMGPPLSSTLNRSGAAGESTLLTHDGHMAPLNIDLLEEHAEGPRTIASPMRNSISAKELFPSDGKGPAQSSLEHCLQARRSLSEELLPSERGGLASGAGSGASVSGTSVLRSRSCTAVVVSAVLPCESGGLPSCTGSGTPALRSCWSDLLRQSPALPSNAWQSLA
mmetsp:Transcript_26192/g.61074  ORF Transcript_26192/g.61074 Transcript_26192/m.61074 type:complete len:239 (+) Transcript_26192:1605-2321(+)